MLPLCTIHRLWRKWEDWSFSSWTQSHYPAWIPPYLSYYLLWSSRLSTWSIAGWAIDSTMASSTDILLSTLEEAQHYRGQRKTSWQTHKANLPELQERALRCVYDGDQYLFPMSLARTYGQILPQYCKASTRTCVRNDSGASRRGPAYDHMYHKYQFTSCLFV